MVADGDVLLESPFYLEYSIPSKAHDYSLFWESQCYSEYAIPTRTSMALLLTAIYAADVLLESLLMFFTFA